MTSRLLICVLLAVVQASVIQVPMKQAGQAPAIEFADHHLYEEKPRWVQTCELSDPEIDKCMRDSVQLLLAALISGETETQPLDPLKVARAQLQQTRGRGSQLQADFTSLVCTGARELSVETARYVVENGSLEVTARLTGLQLDAKYELRGHVLLLPVEGRGTLAASFGPVRVRLVLQLELRPRSQVLGATVTALSLHTESLSLKMAGLFPADPRIGTQLSATLGTSALELFSESRVDLEGGVARILQRALNETLSRLPAGMWLQAAAIQTTATPVTSTSESLLNSTTGSSEHHLNLTTVSSELHLNSLFSDHLNSSTSLSSEPNTAL